MMSDKALLIAKEEIISTIQYNKPDLSYFEVEEIAKHLLDAIDWDNSALMHKGLEWITLTYLNQNIHA